MEMKHILLTFAVALVAIWVSNNVSYVGKIVG